MLSGEIREEAPEFVRKELFDLVMKKNWEQVMTMYRVFPGARKAKLTKSEDTALHLAVSSYQSDDHEAADHARIVGHLVEAISGREEEEAIEILSLKNEKGDTPLHLAAALGSEPICRSIAGKHKRLMIRRNYKGETPLFLAAHHGKMEAFVYLDELYKYTPPEGNEEHDESLCRRKDGDTILHSAISGEYFELAHLIIKNHPKLVNFVNEDGFSPLHFLARQPNVFPSNTSLQLFERVIYAGLIVGDLKTQTFSTISNNISPHRENYTLYPNNYKTCVNFFSTLWKAFRIIVPLGKDGRKVDEENPIGEYEERQGEGFNLKASFPPNYATCIRFVKFFVNILLTILGIGMLRISKIKHKKEKHRGAVQIMTELIIRESSYDYAHSGRRPTQELERIYEERQAIPLMPPQELESIYKKRQAIPHMPPQELEPISEDWPFQDYNAGMIATGKMKKAAARHLTALLLTAKNGITEMVKMILETFPVAIQDLDENEKNALLLAVENRQMKVYDLLLEMKLPEFVFYQVDDEGNSVMHLAAQFQQNRRWQIPGAALQMQWEVKWYEHVKRTIPRRYFIRYNKVGETANEIFTKTHKQLVQEGTSWLSTTSESCSLVAVLIATVAFATSTTVPGGVHDETGRPILEKEPAFQVFSIASIVSLCSSVSALVFFLAILTSRCQQQDFKYDLPRKLLFGLTSLFTSIAAILITFCAGHFFILKDQLRLAAFPIYMIACLPIIIFAFAQLPLYFDLLRSSTIKVPLRRYKYYYH